MKMAAAKKKATTMLTQEIFVIICLLYSTRLAYLTITSTKNYYVNDLKHPVSNSNLRMLIALVSDFETPFANDKKD